MNEPILILGAGVYQVPLIEAAKTRGLETIVASRPGPYPGVELADQFVPVDIADRNGVLAVARKFDVQAIATAGADAGLPALGLVVDELGLPGPGADAALRSTDKALMKSAFVAAGVPSARHEKFQQIEPARVFADELGYPLMVKAAVSSGSRGVTRVANGAEFAAAWQEAVTQSRNQVVIVEDFLQGREYGAQAVMHGDQVAAVFVHDDSTTTGPVTTPVGHAMPATLSPEELRQTEAVVTAAAAAVGLRDCVANVDLMLTESGPQVIEIGGRMGATGIPEMIRLYSGWEIYDHVLDLALGRATTLPPITQQANAVCLLRSEQSGVIKGLEVPPKIRDHPHLVSLQWDVAPGDRAQAFRVGPDRLGLLQVRGESAAEAVAMAETLRVGINIVIRENS